MLDVDDFRDGPDPGEVLDADRQRRYDEAYGQGVVVLSGWLEPVE